MNKIKRSRLFRTAQAKLLAYTILLALLLCSCKSGRQAMKNIVSDDTRKDKMLPTGPKSPAFLQGVIHIYMSELVLEKITMNESGDIILSSFPSSITSILKALKASKVCRLFPPAGKYEDRSRKEGLHRWFIVTFDKSISPTKACEMMLSVPEIEKAEAVPEATMLLS